MIRLREGNNIVGYAPMLKKQYSDYEIRHMSKFSYYEGWSELSRFVMDLQAIEYEEDEGFKYDKANALRLVDIRPYFSFECLWPDIPDRKMMEIYLSQIYEVFQNLKLYRLEQTSIEHINKTVLSAKEAIGFFVSEHTIANMYDDMERMIENAGNTTIDLNNLLALFSENGFPAINLFDIPSDEVKRQLNIERKIEKKLMCF